MSERKDREGERDRPIGSEKYRLRWKKRECDREEEKD